MNYHELKKRIARFFHGPARRKPSRAERAGLVLGEEGNEVQRESGGAFQGKIKFRGQGNIVRFLAESHFTGDIKVHGDNHLIEFGAHSKIKGRIFANGAGRKVIFGTYTTAAGVNLVCGENKDITIGRDCMFSREIEIRTSDAHSVVDALTGDRLNLAQPVIIGDHVWVGHRVIINKGSVIPSNSIVGAMSFVNGSFEEEGIILAGTPARVVKRGITWNRQKKRHFSPEELDQWRGK
jgi:acetyltransferase-like isoleucine patch superfamily enzyme